MKCIQLQSVDSTNAWLRERQCGMDGNTMVVCRCQTAGRGQRGNSWESAPYLNVTMSVLVRPEGLGVSECFVLSQAVALATASVVEDLLRDALGDHVPEVQVKWPNDIYIGRQKVAGILIEQALSGCQVSSSIIGIGLNVNQVEWLSDAPNPVSLRQVTGLRYSVDDIALKLGQRVCDASDALCDNSVKSQVRSAYRRKLWHGQGVHRYVDAVSAQEFEAEVANIHPSGHMELVIAGTGEHRIYAFKEVIQVF